VTIGLPFLSIAIGLACHFHLFPLIALLLPIIFFLEVIMFTIHISSFEESSSREVQGYADGATSSSSSLGSSSGN